MTQLVMIKLPNLDTRGKLYLLGTSIPMYRPHQLSIILMEDFKSVGIGYIDVSRKVRDDECGCLGVFEWRITFTTAKRIYTFICSR